VIGIGVYLDLHHLDAQPFWLDEAISESVGLSSGSAFVKLAFARETNMAFYYLVLHWWLALVPPSDFTIRLLSVICAVAALPVLYVVATKLFDNRVGVAAALLLAVNPTFVGYSQEARSYSLAILLSLVSWSTFIDCAREPTRLASLKYVAATTLAVYTHSLAVLIIPAQGLTLLYLQREWSKRRPLLLAMSLVGLLLVPILILTAYWYSGGEDWIAKKIGVPGLASLREVAVTFAGGITPPRVRQRSLEALTALGFAMFLVNFVKGLRQPTFRADGYACAAIALVTPIALLMYISQAIPIFIVRYVLICLPFYILIVAAGWCQLKSDMVAASGVALLVLLSLWADQAYYSYSTRPNWRQASDYVRSSARDGDRLIFVPAYVRLEFDHNLKRFCPRRVGFSILYPQWNSVFEVGGKYYENAELSDAALKLTPSRLWVVIEPELADVSLRRLVADLSTRYPSVSVKDFGRLWIIVCALGSNSIPSGPHLSLPNSPSSAILNRSCRSNLALGPSFLPTIRSHQPFLSTKPVSVSHAALCSLNIAIQRKKLCFS
jgi:mannosyltransferase